MSDGVWRNVRFFESEPLPPSSPLGELNAVCACLTPTALVVGDYEGQIFFLDRTAPGSVVCSFQAYAGAVTHLAYAALRNSLVTIGDDDALNTAVLRVWDLDQILLLYRGLLDSQPVSPSASNAPADTAGMTAPATATSALRWRPPCQEHRLLATAGRAAAHHAGLPSAEELPLVPILLQESKQLQYTFRPTLAPAPPGSSSGGGGASPSAAAAATAVSCGSIRSPVVSLAVASDLSCVAVGLASRDCVVLRGDVTKERAVRAQTIRSGLAKGALTYVGLPSPLHATLSAGQDSRAAAAAAAEGLEGPLEAGGFFGGYISGRRVTAGDAAAGPQSASASVQVLYTVHEDVVTCWALRPNGNWSEYPCPTAGGAPRFGAALTPRGELLLLGRQTTAYASGSRIVRIGPPPPPPQQQPSGGAPSASPPPYNPTVKASVQTIDVDHAPGRCFLYTYRTYLALLVQQEGRPEQFQLQCYDLAYRLRGLSRQQEGYVNCAAVLGDDSELLVLVQDPAVRAAELSLRGVRLREVDVQTRLELLFSKECYGIAQQLAETMEAADPTLQMRIRKKYGDYLYAKGKAAEAMAQYVETIGYLESSYVIRRYMGSAHMEELIRYLEELHHQRHSQHANVAHTTLLLRCYRKLHDAARLEAFVHRDDIRFDPQNAVEVCREGGYAEAALYVADRYAQVHDCARIRLYDMQEPLATLDYLRTLGVDEAEGICAQLGKDLLAAAPRATTELLMELCVYWKGPGRRLVEAAVVSAAGAGGVGSASPTPLPPDSAPFYSGSVVGLSGLRRHQHRASPSAFLHVFVDSPVCLMNFLRAVVESGVLDEEGEGEGRQPQPEDGAATVPAVSPHAVLYNTLLELYMTRVLKDTLQLVPAAALPRRKGDGKAKEAAAGFPEEPYERRLEQARTFLEAYKGRYDHYLALSLAHQHHFQDGVLYLLRALGLSDEILRYYSATLNDPHASAAERGEATTKLFQACKDSPGGDSGTTALWMTLLAQLVRTSQTAWQDTVKVLDYIAAHDALSPVVVLEILSSHPQSSLQLRTVRDYCQRCLLRQTRQVQEVLTATAQHLAELETTKTEVTALQTSAVVFQSTACAHCHQQLDTPAVYFMCKHAFHHRCLYTATECNICATEHRRRLDQIRESQHRDGQRQHPSSFTAQFFEEVQKGSRKATGDAAGEGATPQDGFEVMAGYVARGVLGAPPLYRDAGLFGVEPAVPLRGGGSAARPEAEEVMNPGDLEVW